RRLREEAGYTAQEAAAAINAQGPKISKLENGNQAADPEDIRQLAQFYSAPDDQQDYLVKLAEAQPKRRRRKRADQRDAVPDWFRRFLALEWDATEIRTFQLETIHGL